MAADVRAAERHWLLAPSRRRVVRRLADGGGWSAPGTVTVTDRHLAFDGPERRRTSRATVEGAERTGGLVWVRRRRAHDWLVRCRTDAEAEAVVDALGDARLSAGSP